LEKTKDLLQNELVSMSSKMEAISLELAELRDLRNQLQDLKQRYNTALELIGDKEEQVEELKADLEDMKLLYKTQINDLVCRIEVLLQNPSAKR